MVDFAMVNFQAPVQLAGKNRVEFFIPLSGVDSVALESFFDTLS